MPQDVKRLSREEIGMIENETGLVLTGIRDNADGSWEALGLGDSVIWTGSSPVDKGKAVAA